MESSHDGTTYTDTNTQPGVSYQYRVAAANAIGIGPYSDAVNAITPTIPGIVTDLSVTILNNTVSLSWSAPHDGRSNITGYVIQRSTDNSSWSIMESSHAGTTYTDIQAQPGVPYEYRVAAANAIGIGPYSDAVTTLDNLPDTVSPVITLYGPTNMTLQVGLIYTDPGYLATDDVDGNITDSVIVTGIVNADTPGVYIISYDVTDSSGNAAITQTRTITVLLPTDSATYCHDMTLDQLLNSGMYNVMDMRSSDASTITGTNDNDLILLGDDGHNVFAHGGADCIIGGSGSDRIWGYGGDDIIYGNDGIDDIYGNNGDDIIYGGDGNDGIYAGNGDDTIYGNNGADNLDGGSGDDTIYGGDGGDRIWGRTGSDIIHGNAGSDWLNGNRGDDIVYGDIHDTAVHGGGDVDTCYGPERAAFRACEVDARP